jgi:hypothetical protein
MNDQSKHWEKVYQTKSADAVSWFQEHASRSLDIIRSIGANKTAGIIDVGGGASTFSDRGLRPRGVYAASDEVSEARRVRYRGDIRAKRPRAVQWFAGGSVRPRTTAW